MASFEERLAHESTGWVGQGILAPEQRERILALYPTTPPGEGRTMRIVAWIGGTLVGVGIILWVASNWQYIPDAARTLLLVAVTAAFLAGGWWLMEDHHVALAHTSLGLGGVGIGGTIFQVANWGHLPPDNPLLLLLWMVCLVPLAYAYRSLPFLLEAILVLPFWIGFAASDGRDADSMPMLFTLAALGLLSLGRLHDRTKWPGFRIVLEAAGAAGILLLGFIATFAYAEWVEPIRFSWLLLGLALVAIPAFGAALYFEALPALRPTWHHAVLACLALIGVVAMFGTDQVLVNILYPALLIGLILAGVQARNEVLLNIGFLFFIIEIIGRYFDFLFDNLDPSLFFIVGGLLMLALAFGVARLRRRLAAQMQGGGRVA